MDDLLTQFLIEAPELIQDGGEALLALEKRPGERALLDSAFRAVHTLKGSVGLFDLPAMGRALHAAEDLLGELRGGRRPIDAQAISALLAVLGQCEHWIEALERGQDASPEDDAIAAALAASLIGADPASSTGPSAAASPWAQELAAQAPEARGALVAVRYRPDRGSYFTGDDPIAIARATPGPVHVVLGLTEQPAETAYDPFVCRLTLDILSDATLDEVKAAFRFVPDQVEFSVIIPEPAKVAASEAAATRSLRIDPRRIDALAASAADLVAAKTGVSALASLAASGGDPRLIADTLLSRAAALERLVGRLHDEVMALRMAPISGLLRRYPRLARELAAGLGKEVDVTVDDPGLEVDKDIIEGLAEPLTHLLRNAIDHGVEPPAERRATGKPACAEVRLVARRDGTNLLLELRDDGRGMAPAALRNKAAERGLLSADALAGLSDDAVLDLIFLPGFSTAESVTEVSGRGVGMDAVKTALARMGGRVRLTSSQGVGTCVSLVLPLSLVLSKIMIVEADGEQFGVPMDRVVETLRLARDKVFPIRQGRAFEWRDRSIPLLDLATLVGGEDAKAEGDLRVLTVRCADQVVGLAVDTIADRADVVLRPLTGLLAAMPGIAGSAVLADGKILMVLDPEGLVG